MAKLSPSSIINKVLKMSTSIFLFFILSFIRIEGKKTSMNIIERP